MRKLATIEMIKEILPHTNADTLELAIVRGWQVVVKKGDFKVGAPVIFFEVDSWVPHELAPFLSRGHEPREFEGVKGERLRTVKLRGELSQGLVLPVQKFDGMLYVLPLGQTSAHAGNMHPVSIGDDVTEILGVLKWEPPISAQLAGHINGNFPTFICKTDQERVQNCYSKMAILDNHPHGGNDWNVEEKLDGSSCTVFVNFDLESSEGLYEVGICSRNFKLKIGEENKDNVFVKTVTEVGYLDHIHKLDQSLAIQGELCGPGIQGNKYQLQYPVFFVFDVYLIDKGRYATREERWDILQSLITLGVKVNQVPHLGTIKIPDSIKECLTMADGQSKVNPQTKREGIVFKSRDVIENQVVSFKVISNQFLLKHDS